MKKPLAKLLSLFLVLMLLVGSLPAAFAATTAGGDKGTPNGAPATPSVTHNAWNGEPDYQISLNIWWGNNATSYDLYENDVLVDSGTLEANSPNGQSHNWSFAGKTNGTYVYKLDLANSYGKNSGSTTVRVVNGKNADPDPENTAPVLSGVKNQTINMGDSFSALKGVTASDKEDGDLTAKIKVSGTVDTGKAGSYTLTYTVTDAGGKTAAATAVITVKDSSVPAENTAPVLSGVKDQTIKVGDSFRSLNGVTASDKEDGDLTSKIKVSGAVDTGKAGSYTLTYTVTDAGGKTAAATAVITVKENSGDITATVWAVMTDYKVGDIVSYSGKYYECRMSHLSLDGWQPANVPALWIIYEGDPPAPENAAPALSGVRDQTIKVGDSFSALSGVTASDKEDGDLTSKIKVSGAVDTGKAGSYTLTYTVTDAGGKTAAATAVITVKDSSVPAENTAPVLSGVRDQAIKVGDSFSALKGVTASDKEDGDLTASIVVKGAVDTAKAGVYVLTYTVTDKGGKTAMAQASVTVSENTSPEPSDSPLPDRVLTGYWQNFDNGATCLKLGDVPKEYNIICISFADAAGAAGAITFNLDSTLSQRLGGYTTADFKADVTKAHDKGQKVVLAIGGELGNVTINSAASAKAFADSAYALMQEYGFDGVDIDLEHGINVPYLADSLHQLAAKAGKNFILTMAPQTMDIYTKDATYLKLGREVSDILTIMNTQYYNSGSMPGYDGNVYNSGTVDFLTSLTATQLENGLRPDQVGLGLPATSRGAGSGYQAPANVAKALESLVYGTKGGNFTPPKAYNNLRGAMTWSINWDATSGYQFAKTIAACFAKLPPVDNGGTPDPKNESPVLYGARAQTLTVGDVFNPRAGVTASDKEDGDLTSKIVVTGSVNTQKAGVYEITYSVTDSQGAVSKAAVQITVKEKSVDPMPGSNSRLLIGYWHSWGGGPSGGVPFVKLRDVDPNWDVINISFAEPVSAGSTNGRMKMDLAGLSSSYTRDDFKADIKLLQSQGKKIVLSIGGYEGYFSLTSDAAVKQFVSDIKGFVDEFGFDGIDIDLEQSSVTFDSGNDPDVNNPKSPKIVNMITAIRQICSSYGKDFILSWAPETFYMQLGYQFYGGSNANCDSRGGVYLPMINALREETTYVHVQLYNSIVVTAPDGKTYSMGSAEAAVAMCKMLLQGFDAGNIKGNTFAPLRPDQVVIGVPSSAGAAGSGQMSNAAIQQAFTELNSQFPGMRGIMTWSINWDAYQNNNSFAKENGTFLHSVQ